MITQELVELALTPAPCDHAPPSADHTKEPADCSNEHVTAQAPDVASRTDTDHHTQAQSHTSRYPSAPSLTLAPNNPDP